LSDRPLAALTSGVEGHVVLIGAYKSAAEAVDSNKDKSSEVIILNPCLERSKGQESERSERNSFNEQTKKSRSAGVEFSLARTNELFESDEQERIAHGARATLRRTERLVPAPTSLPFWGSKQYI
jgi:hypothetical protein